MESELHKVPPEHLTTAPERKPEPRPERPRPHVTNSELSQWFGFQPATGRAAELHVDVRQAFLDMALWLNEVLPEGPNKTLAFRHLEDAAHRANKAIALDPSVH